MTRAGRSWLAHGPDGVETDFYQLKTFIAVAREGSITRASERVHLSQPAVSAHIKAIEDTLGLSLFARTPRGMSLTPDGQRLLAKAEQTVAAHQELMDEATRVKGRLTGKLRLGRVATVVRVLFAYLAVRAQDPLLQAAASALRVAAAP